MLPKGYAVASTAQLIGIVDAEHLQCSGNENIHLQTAGMRDRKTQDAINGSPLIEAHDSTQKHGPIYTNSRRELVDLHNPGRVEAFSAIETAGIGSNSWCQPGSGDASLGSRYDDIHQDSPRSGVRQGGENVSADSFADDNDGAGEDLWMWEAKHGCVCSSNNQNSVSSSKCQHQKSTNRQTLPNRRRHNIAKIQLDQAGTTARRFAPVSEPSTPRPGFVSSSRASTSSPRFIHATHIAEDIYFSPPNVNFSSISFSEPLVAEKVDILTPTQERYDAARRGAADEDNALSEPESEPSETETKLMLKPEQVDRLVRALAESPLLRNHVSKQWFDDGSEATTVVSVPEREDTPSLTSGSSAEASPLYTQTDQSFSAEQRSPIATRDLLEDDFANQYPDHPKARRLSKEMEPQFGGIAMVDPKVQGAPVRSISRGFQQGANVLQVGHCSFVNIPFGTTVHASLRVEPASNRSINCRIMLQVVNQILDRKSSRKSSLLVAELDVTESFIRAALLELSAHSGMSLDEIEMIAPGVRPMLKEDLDWCKLADELQNSLAIRDVVGTAAASFAHLSARTCTMQTLTLMSELERLKIRHQDFLVVRPTGYHTNGMMSGISMPWISQHLDQSLYDAKFMTHRDEASNTARLLRERVVSAITEGCSGSRPFDTRIWWGDQMRQIHCVPLHERADGRPTAWVAFLSGESVFLPFRISH